MIDIHPPQHGSMTRKDFFVHLGIVVLGILIAIGLEQVVEYIHRRHEIAETREALRQERDANITAYSRALAEFRQQDARLLNNLTVLRFLQQHPHTSDANLPGILLWHATRVSFSESAWKTAQQSNVTSLMPQDEVRRDARLYERVDQETNAFDAMWPCIIRARLYALDDPDPSHLTPAQLAEEITYTRDAIVQNYVYAAALVQLAGADHGFSPALSPEELNTRMHVSQMEHNPNFAAAVARTNARISAANTGPLP